MSFRKIVKKFLYGSCPGVKGAFPYFGTKVFFPPRSHIFERACEQGVYENENVMLIDRLIREDSWYLDIGANLGLMSIPFLAAKKNLTIVSFEPSSNTLPFLAKTIANSGYGERWKLIDKAVGATSGKVTFFLSSAQNSAYEGLRETTRVNIEREETVNATTVDDEWERFGMPAVSFIKCDVEGGEAGVLRGATRCIAQCRPYILLEWNAENLRAYQIEPGELLKISQHLHYEVFAVPALIGIKTPADLKMQMLRTENFLLVPDETDLQPTATKNFGLT